MTAALYAAADIARLPAGQFRRACPQCQRSKRDTALSVTVEPGGKRLSFCHRCGHTAVEFPPRDRALRGTSGAPVVRVVHEVLSPGWAQVWAGCGPVEGIAREYLLARECVIPPADGDLRWHPKLPHPCGYTGPALVALVTHAVTCAPLTLHRTWIQADGTKAEIDTPRLLLSGHRKAGGVIRLWPDECVTTGLGIAEGIESALSAAHVFTPVWSCLDAGNLAAFPVLNGIDALTVFGDNDVNGAGQKAAQECVTRWRKAGREAEQYIPITRGHDPNEWWRGLSAADKSEARR
jgi:hypothetical protein